MTSALDGRYEARDHGPDRPWTSALATADGAWFELPDRPDAERDALLGRDVTVHGTIAGTTIVDATVSARGELDDEPLVPPSVPGPRTPVEVLETTLAMTSDRAPPLAAVPAPPGLAVITAAPSVRYYRFLYDAVGAPWHWWNRKWWDDAKLAAHLARPGIELHVLHEHGVPVGYLELDRTVATQCEIGYFGLVPEATGRGLGRWFLTWAIHAAWSDPALARLWVHTCTLDGPAALPTYRRAGFTACKHDRYRTATLAASLGEPPC